MSTRDDSRAAFKRHGPMSLTELAQHCPSCENDRQIVASAIAALRAEGRVKSFGLDAGNKPVYSIDRWPDETASTAAERAPDRAPLPVTTPSPARPADPPEDHPLTVKERIAAALEKHGPMTIVEIRERVKVEAASVYVSQMIRAGNVTKLAGGRGSTVYGLPGQKLKDAPAQADALERGAELGRRKAQPTKGHGRKAGRRKPSRNGGAPGAHRTPPAPQPNGKSAAFAINEYGEVGIHRGDEVMKLDAAEFARLREFIERTEPVWQGGK